MSRFQIALARLHNALSRVEAEEIMEAAQALAEELDHITPEDGPALWAVQTEISFLYRYYTQRHQPLPASGNTHVYQCPASA